jgi:lysophospholipase L1-like esterase
VVGIALLSAIFLLQEKPGVAHATDPTTWVDGIPNVVYAKEVNIGDYSSTDPSGCTNMTIPVVRNLLDEIVTKNEDHCMMMAGSTLIDSMMTIVQPTGSSKAYPVWSKPGGPKSLMATPSGLTLYMDYSPPYEGEYIAVYQSLANHITFNNDLLNPEVSISSPDYNFHYPGISNPIVFMPQVAFSNSSDYMVAEAEGYGFVRINLNTLKMTFFAHNTITNSAGNHLGAESEISPSGKYAAVAYNAPGEWGDPYFKVVDVDSCGDTDAAFNASITTCKSFDYWPQLASKIPGLTGVYHVKFASDNSLSFVAQTGRSTTAHYYLYQMSPDGQPTRMEEYLGMGDSFASGEGTFNYIDGTNTELNKCHQSIYAYPSLMNSAVGSSASVACSGAVMRNINGDPIGQKSNQLKDVLDSEIPESQADAAKLLHTPGVVAQDDFVGRDNPQIITISIGGNDVGFSDIISRCIVPFNDVTSTSQNCYETYEDRKELVNTINSKYYDLVQTYSRLANNDPTRRVYVIGYPQITSDDVGSCALNVHLSQSDRAFAVQLTSYLDEVIQNAAAQAGVFYVDTQDALDGHRLCDAGEPAVNGLTAGNDTWYKVGNESYHPNQLGHQLLADTILTQTNNLTAPMPAKQNIPFPSEESLPILQAQHTGRIVYNVINGGKDVVYVTSGGIVNLYEDSYTNVIRSDGFVEEVLHSDPVDLGRAQVDSNGVITGSVKIPADTVPGFHTLHLYGQNKFGEPIDIQQMVYVVASADDYDGDGILNVDDSCQGVPNSGQDQDQDGIDDACDPLIGPAPTNQGNGNDNDNKGKGKTPSNGDELVVDDTCEAMSGVNPFPVKPWRIQTAASNKELPAAAFFGQLQAACSPGHTRNTTTTVSAPTVSIAQPVGLQSTTVASKDSDDLRVIVIAITCVMAAVCARCYSILRHRTLSR